MAHAAEEKDVRRCRRCMQPVPPKLRRCPHCLELVPKPEARLHMILGIGGVLALLFIIGLMVVMARNEDIENSPSPDTQQSAPIKDAPLDR